MMETSSLLDRAHGRQTAPTLAGIRADHLYRYEWAAKALEGLRVLDAGCGIGYGSFLLGEANCTVTAVDGDADAINRAREFYAHENVTHACQELEEVDGSFDAIVCFEVLEHIENAEDLIKRFGEMADRLLCSVPNEEVMPFEQTRPLGHLRHYTPGEFRTLLRQWDIPDWHTIKMEFHQNGKFSGVGKGFSGRTLVADLRR